MATTKVNIVLAILLATTFFSCHEIYNPQTESVPNALVVDGLITDEATFYSIKLSNSVPYDSTDAAPPVGGAKVSVSDDCGIVYQFNETSKGLYQSNPAELVGQPGKTYTLHIETPDGNAYESRPQTMLPNDFTMNAYAQYASQDNLLEDSYRNVSKVTTQGVNLLVDIDNNADTVPRFRFDLLVTTEYTYSVAVSPIITYVFYCWSTLNPNDLANLTDEKFQTSSTDIKKHTIYFQPTNYFYLTSFVDTTSKKDSLVEALIINNVITLKRYRINSQTFQYYKNINLLLSAQGKLFDPIAFQLQGNITCKTNPKKQVLGFFEASSIRTNFYAIRPGKIEVKPVPSFNLTKPYGCRGGGNSPNSPYDNLNPPDFWVY